MNRDFRRAFRILLRMKNPDDNAVVPYTSSAEDRQSTVNTVSATVTAPGTVADPEICPRGDPMTDETCGPTRRPSFF